MSVFGFDPRVERHLIADEGEVIVDEVRKHWAAVVGAMLEMTLAVPALILLVVGAAAVVLGFRFFPRRSSSSCTGSGASCRRAWTAS